MKKYKIGNYTVKAYLESWNGGKAIRTVYIDDFGNKVVKINGNWRRLYDFRGNFELF